MIISGRTEVAEIHAEPRLVELGRTECLILLAGKQVGRVVVTHRSLPAAYPVHYMLDGEEVIFRTPRGSTLSSTAIRAVVAFQVDDVDVKNRSGWSVHGIGEAYEVVDQERLDTLQRAVSPWWGADGPGHTVAIPLQILYGKLTRSCVLSRLRADPTPPHDSSRAPDPGPPRPLDDRASSAPPRSSS